MTGPGQSAGEPPVAALCREYAALAAPAAAGFADFLDGVATLAVRMLPTARAARIRVHHPQVMVVADPPGAAGGADALAIPLVARGDVAGVLELDPAGREGFPPAERELAEALAVLLTLSLSA